MNVVAFPFRTAAEPGHWRADELQQLIALFGDPAKGEARSWDIGATEHGDPQFYVLGPAPEHDCMLCISRLAQGYVIEDGTGRVIGEAPSLDSFAEQAARAAVRGSRSFIARVTLLVATVRLAIEEKVEPIFEESQELLVRFAPQLAAFV
jgi:hypothetical protein